MSDLLTPAAEQAAPGAAALEPAVECRSLVRIYRTGNLEVQALQGLELRIERGEFVAIVGASGSGKSTLLGILSGLDAPSAGSVRVDGRELATLKTKERLDYRRRTVGFMWQSPPRNLIPQLTAVENVMMPQRFTGIKRSARRARALELLDSMGASYCKDRVPGQLSGGEQQRVAIAVALANNPALLLADEPTGELDSETAQQVFAALREANTVHGVTTLIVTHDEAVSGQVRRTVAIRDGRTSTETFRPGADAGAAGRLGPALHGEEEVEYVVVDRSGRLQLPHDLVDQYEIKDRVRLTREPGHIGVWADRETGEEEK